MAALPPPPRTAVVMGASIAGIMSAAALARKFDKVILLDRDACPDDSGPLLGRHGVPQDSQTHVFMSAGRAVAEELMPGFVQQLVENGALAVDRTRRFKYFYDRKFLKQYQDGTLYYSCVRAVIDRTMRQMLDRTFGRDKIEWRWGTPAAGLEVQEQRVVGVRLEDDSVVRGDVVLDCMGASSPMEKWLVKAGFEEPTKWAYEIRLGYSTMIWELPQGDASKFDCDGLFVFHVPERNQLNRGVIAFRILPKGLIPNPGTDDANAVSNPTEPRFVTATVYGFHEDQPKCATPEEWMAFCRTVSTPLCAEYLEGAKPMGLPKPFTKPKQLWRRYDLAKRWPEGLISVGDAFCAMDPTLGQGMTLSCQCAGELARHAAKLASRAPGAARATQRAIAARRVKLPFLLNAVIDYRMAPVKPTYENFKPPLTWLLHPLLRSLFRASSRSSIVFSQFIRMSHLECGPEVLLRPDVFFLVMVLGFC